MFIKQLSIFVENRHGRLEKIIDALVNEGINIKALSLADTTNFGIIRLIVDDNERAKKALDKIGVVSKTTDVIAVYIDDKTGGLHSVLKIISKEGISIEYMYAFLGRKEGKALMVLKSDDNDKTISILSQNDIELFEF